MHRTALRRAGDVLAFRNARKVLVVSKVTRYESEVVQFTSLTGSTYDHERFRQSHEVHESYVEVLVRELQRLNHLAQVKVVKCFGELTPLHIAGADFIFSLGGDGTFLRTASFLQEGTGRSPVICGINTDPNRSEGYLCANHQASASGGRLLEASEERIGEFLQQLVAAGDVRYITRQRLRVNVDPEGGACGAGHGRRFLALNDVLVAEREPQKASYYKLHFSTGTAGAPGEEVTERQKSSGLIVSTGTGSTAWHRSVSSLHPARVQRLLEVLRGRGAQNLPASPESVAEEYNGGLGLEPEQSKMSFVVRDPIINGVFTCDNFMGFASGIAVHPRSGGLQVFADGQLAVPLPLGHVVTFSIHPEDALTAVQAVHAAPA